MIKAYRILVAIPDEPEKIGVSGRIILEWTI
jgi:hypothetical protein